MSLQRIFEALIGLGLSENDSKVYIKIAINGPMTAKNLIEELKINKQQLYPILKKLRNQGIIKMTDVRPFVISALPFEVVLQMLIDRKFDESKEILENKEELLSCWKAVNWNNGT
jgi:sugar-specific transcriptional regulator TrmB